MSYQNLKIKKLIKKMLFEKIDNELKLKCYNPRQKHNKNTVKNKKFNLPDCRSCIGNSWIEYDLGFFCKICENEIKKQKQQIDKKVLRRNHDFSTRLY